MKLLTCLTFLSLMTLAGVAAPSDPFVVIERLELARSPGGNTLASFLSRGEPAVAARAALALGRTKKPLAADPLLQHTQASDAGIRAMVIYALGLLAEPLAPSPSKSVTPTARATPGPNARVTIQLGPLLSALTKDRRERAGSAIVAALDDGSDAVKVAALDAVGRFAAAHAFNATVAGRALERVSRQLHRSAAPAIRGRAAVTLAALGADARLRPRAQASLIDAFTHEDDANARWHEMWALGRAFAKDVSHALVATALRDESDLVRIQGLHAIARSGDKTWLSELEPLTHDPNWRVNEEARETIAYLNTGKRTEHLAEIPDGVVTPSPAPSSFDTPSALPRPSFTGKPSRPTIAQMIFQPRILPRTLARMTRPAAGPHPRVRILTTEGPIVVILFPEWAPSTVANFLNLTNRGYYDGLRWFRIVPDFVAQTGDPNDNGEGDAGYMIPAEENPLEQDSGIISMGLNYDKNGPQRDSAGTQFYITMSPQPHLNRDFTVFGRVESGFDVLGRLIESDRMTRVEQIPDTTIPI